MYPVLSDTCYIFAQTEIDFRSLLAGKRRRTSFGGMYAAFRIRVYGMRMDLSRVEFQILRAMTIVPEKGADWIIVLGAQVRGTYITNSLKRRLDAALSYLEGSPRSRVIVSGGMGPGEDITEAEAMAGYLIKCGVPQERIFLEDCSTSTRENLRFSRKYTDAERDRVGIVTNDFHIYRSSLIARQEGYKNVIMIPAGSNPVFQINYLMREFFAVVHTLLVS